MADTGFVLGGSVSDSGTSWVNPNNVLADDSSGTNSSWTLGGATSDLRVTNFGLSVPTGATIDGIEVKIDKLAVTTGTVELSLALTKNGTAQVGVAVGSVLANQIDTHGSPTDLWVTTWTPSEVNASTFGVLVTGYDDGSGSGQANIDVISVRVYYTEAVTPITYYLPARRRGR